MKIKAIAYILTCINFIYTQNNETFKKTPNVTQLIGSWKFESMTTITKARREEIKIVYKDKKNSETLSFFESGSLTYVVLNDGIEKNGDGIWYATENFLTIIVGSDTTYGSYKTEDNILTIILKKQESYDYYGYSTILEYIHH